MAEKQLVVGDRRQRAQKFTAADRAAHLAIEKERREAFNDRLLELASLIPQLENAKRSQLSKSVVVEEAIRHIRHLVATAHTSSELLASVSTQNDALVLENNQLRGLLDAGLLPPPIIDSTQQVDFSQILLEMSCAIPDPRGMMPELDSPMYSVPTGMVVQQDNQTSYYDDQLPRGDDPWQQMQATTTLYSAV